MVYLSRGRRGAAGGVLRLQGPRRSRTCGHQLDWIFRLENRGVLEDASSILGNCGHGERVMGIRRLCAPVVSANGLLDVAVEVVEKVTKQEACVGGKDRTIYGVQIKLALRAQVFRQK